MTYVFHPDAEQEFVYSIDYYEECEEGLGLDFSLEVFETIQHILKHPHAWPVLEGDIRRHLVSRFPYGVLYAVESDHINIIAVMPLHREPGYWKDRSP